MQPLLWRSCLLLVFTSITITAQGDDDGEKLDLCKKACHRRFDTLGIMDNCSKDQSVNQCMCESQGLYGVFMCCLEEVCPDYGLEVGSGEDDQRLAVPCVVGSSSWQVTLNCPASYLKTQFADASTTSSSIETTATTTASGTTASTLSTQTTAAPVPSETEIGEDEKEQVNEAAAHKGSPGLTTVGLGVGLGVGITVALVAIGCIVFLIRRHRQKTKNTPSEAHEPPTPPPTTTTQPWEDAANTDTNPTSTPFELGNAEKGPSELATTSQSEDKCVVYELPGDTRPLYGQAV